MEKAFKSDGFTLIELIIAVGLVGVLAALSLPYFKDWYQNARYREASRNIASVLRDARARAISQNVEHRVEFSVTGRSYRMTRGTRAFGSTNWSNVVQGPFDLAAKRIKLKSGTDCNSDSNVDISFNPNGTSNIQYVCIMDESSTPVRKYRVGVESSTTGRVVIRK